MKAAILTVGDEILIGQIVDTNSAWLGQELNNIGIRINTIVSLADDQNEIINGLTRAVDNHDIIFITGGLGPTKDDITKSSIAKYLGVDMYMDEGTLERIKKIFEKMGRELSPLYYDQCLMPQGVELLTNSMGTAPGMLFRHQGKLIISMPGVPYEMKAIMKEIVIPKLLEELTLPNIDHFTILTSCTGETTIESNIKDIVDEMPPSVKVAFLPSLAAVRIRVSGYGTGRQMVEAYGNRIADRLGDIVYGYEDFSLPKAIMDIAVAKGISIGTAESCTAGLIAHSLTSVSGSSAYFIGGIVAYDNRVKTDILGVKEETLKAYGAVSEQTVIEMAQGALTAFNVDVAVAISGIAGPTGGSEAKPVGTMWICVASADRHIAYLLKTGKDREKNVQIATIWAMDMLRKFIK